MKELQKNINFWSDLSVLKRPGRSWKVLEGDVANWNIMFIFFSLMFSVIAWRRERNSRTVSFLISSSFPEHQPLISQHAPWLCPTEQTRKSPNSLISRKWTCSAHFTKSASEVVRYPMMHFTSASDSKSLLWSTDVQVWTQKYTGVRLQQLQQVALWWTSAALTQSVTWYSGAAPEGSRSIHWLIDPCFPDWLTVARVAVRNKNKRNNMNM